MQGEMAMKWMVTALLLACGLWAAGSFPAQATACPMCKAANEADQNGQPNTKPRAYMYSILFMLSMPATLTAGFGFGFYRLWRKGQAQGGETSPPGEGPMDA